MTDIPFLPPSGGVLAIDPGLSGAFCHLSDGGDILAIGDLPVAGEGKKARIDAANFALLVRSLEPRRAVVELVSAMPGQGVSSMFRFGQSVGVVTGVLGALAVPIEWVTPGVWKRAVGIGADKEAGRLKAIETWPAQAQHMARKRDHGRAEAALLGLYLLRGRP
jgi:crossover junction endodeoxyribonuclease RuvC